MKAKLFLLVFALVCLVTPAWALNDDEEVVYVPIVVRPIDNLGNPFRSLTPFQCYYVNGTLTISVLEDLGDVSIIVTDSEGNGCWSAAIEGVDSVVLDINEAHGVVDVTIETASKQYGGEFTIE